MDKDQTSPEPQPPTCPWCPYTDTLLKKVLTHMESAHHEQVRQRFTENLATSEA